MAKAAAAKIKVVKKAAIVAATQAEAEFEIEHQGKQALSVPVGKRPPVGRIQGGMYWIYGSEKIGKTTLASKFPGAWFWATEPGQQWIECYEPLMIHDWDHFLEMCAFVEDTKPTTFGDGAPIKTIVWDTGDLLFKMCIDNVSATLGVEDPSELDHGKGWARLNNEFERVVTKVRRWPFTLVVLSHERQRPFKTKGRQVDRMEPDIGAGGRRILSAASDLILWAHSAEYAVKNEEGEVTGEFGETRVLRCHPSSSVVAGGRMANLLPPIIPLDYDELNAYLTGKKIVGQEGNN